MIENDVSPTEGLKEFFRYIWGDTEGYAYLPTKRMNGDQVEWKKVFYQWPLHEKNIVNHVLMSSAQGTDVYYAPALFKKPGAADKDNIQSVSVVWCDFDGNAPETWTPDAPSEGATEPSPGLSDLPAPSLRVQTSTDGHQHVYWKLDRNVTDIQDIVDIENINRSITYSLRADSSGWDVSQVLRPPYTTNYKHDLPVTVANISDNRFPVGVFKTLPPVVELVSNSIDVSDLPSLEPIIAKYPWDDKTFEMFMSANIEHGRRSDALMRLGYFCCEVGMSDREAYAVLENADSRWKKFVNRTDRKKRLVDIVNRARTKHPLSVNSDTFAGLVGAKTEVNTQSVYNYQDFLDSEVKVEWIIQGLMPKGGFGLIASAPGVGKTQLTLQLAIAEALGLEFLTYEISKPQKVIFFSMEMDHMSLKLFMETISKHYSEEHQAVLQKNFFVVPIGEALYLNRPEAKQFILTILDEIQPDGIIFDSLSKLIPGTMDKENADKMNAFYAGLRARYGCHIWTIHHNRKPNGDNKRPTSQADIYGEVFFTTDMATIMTLWRDDSMQKNHIEMNVVKVRFSAEPDPVILERDENLHFKIVEVTPKTLTENVLKNFKKEKEGPTYGSIDLD